VELIFLIFSIIFSIVKPTVLHVIDNMCLGGAQRIVSTLVKKNDNHKLHVLRESDEVLDGFDDYTITKSSSKIIMPLYDVMRQVKRCDADIVHCHLKKSKIICILLKRLCNLEISLVLHEHGEIWKEGNTMYTRILYYSSKIVDRHIAVSNHTSELLKQKSDIPDQKIDIVYNFVDREKYNKSQLESFGSRLKQEVNKEMFTVGYAGRLEHRKGWKSVVSAAKRNTDIQFLLSGSGSGEYRLIREDEKMENLHYLGFLNDIRTLFSNIDCFVLPSHWDPSPMILYEVQSCGIPLICADVSSIDEIVDPTENAVVYPPQDKEALSKKINELRTDAELRTKISKNGIRNAKKYTFEEFQHSIDGVYSKLMSE
jgi:glycosyltransferase involved in cell wall biosynthesis